MCPTTFQDNKRNTFKNIDDLITNDEELPSLDVFGEETDDDAPFQQSQTPQLSPTPDY